MVIGQPGVAGQNVLFLVEGAYIPEPDHVQTQSHSMAGMSVKEIRLKHRLVILNIVLVSIIYLLYTYLSIIKVNT